MRVRRYWEICTALTTLTALLCLPNLLSALGGSKSQRVLETPEW
jgi:hypothetical protein